MNYLTTDVKLNTINTPHDGVSISFQIMNNKGEALTVHGEYCVSYCDESDREEFKRNNALVFDYEGEIVGIDVCLYDVPNITVNTLLCCCELIKLEYGF